MKKKKIGIYIEITDEDKEIITSLKNKYSINISRFFKNAIRSQKLLLEGLKIK